MQLVQSSVQGRYYTISFDVILLSACLTGALAIFDFAPEACGGVGKRAWASACAIVVIGTLCVHFARLGNPTTDIVQRNAVTVALKADLEKYDAQAIMGSYWWIWDLQYEFNNNIIGTPAVTPVTIRTEAFGLNAFRPITEALLHSKSFRLLCVERPDLPDLNMACGPSIEFFQSRGALPIGNITELSRRNVIRELIPNYIANYTLTLFELGLEHPNDLSECTSSEVTFRAKPLRSSSPLDGAYRLDEDGFVYLQRQTTSAEWVLRFSSDSGEEEARISRGGHLHLDILRHNVELVSEGCRLLIAVSGRGLHVHPIMVDVR